MDKVVSSEYCKVPTKESLSDLLFNVRFYSDAFRVLLIIVEFQWSIFLKTVTFLVCEDGKASCEVIITMLL